MTPLCKRSDHFLLGVEACCYLPGHPAYLAKAQPDIWHAWIQDFPRHTDKTWEGETASQSNALTLSHMYGFFF